MRKNVAMFVYPLPGLLVSLLFVIFGWVIFPSILRSEVTKQVRLVEGSDTWIKWKQPPIPIFLSFYVHHVTNPDEVERGLTPIFQEKGPYAYLYGGGDKQKRTKVDINVDGDKNTVRYKEVKTYFFDQEKSGDNTENDLVNVPNVPFVAVIHTIKKMVPLDIVAGIVGNLILHEEPLVKRNVRVRELLFDGFDVTKYTNSLLGPMLPAEFSGGKFGLYKGKNGTPSEEWEIYTGVDDSNQFGQIKTWDGREYLGFWQPFTPCDKVSGSDGTLFPPFLTHESKMSAFSSDVCRSLNMVFYEEIEHRGVPAYRFGAAPGTYTDPRLNAKNRCFCLEKNVQDCPHSGVLPLESCTKAPIWSSPPHFLNADIRYLHASGMDPPDADKHDTFIDLEPTTGLVIQAHKRVQINLEINPNRKVRSLQRLKDKIIFPVIWADENAEITDELKAQLNRQLFTPLKIVGIIKWVGLSFGLVLFMVGIGLYVQRFVLQNPPPSNPSKKVVDLARPGTTSSGTTGTGKMKRSSAVGQTTAPATSSSSASSVSYID